MYKDKFGHYDVPVRRDKYRSLALWVRTQRSHKRKFDRGDKYAAITAERIAALDAIGFVWEPLEDKWQQMFDELVEFRKQYGHCIVRSRWSLNPRLGCWVKYVRRSKRKFDRGETDTTITAERIAALDALGFVWDPLDTRWQEMYQELVEYRKQYGNCNVPYLWRPNPKLAKWVDSLRQAKKKQDRGERQTEFSAERMAALDAIGFVWEQRESRWQEMCEKLAEYQKQHGNCNVPQRWRPDPQLGKWVDAIRTSKKNYDIGKHSSLNPERIAALERIGFEWRIRSLVKR
jgi:hypothetical protein